MHIRKDGDFQAASRIVFEQTGMHLAAFHLRSKHTAGWVQKMNQRIAIK
jgi:hypothetical protein